MSHAGARRLLLAVVTALACAGAPARADDPPAPDEPPAGAFGLYDAASIGDTNAVADALAQHPEYAKTVFRHSVTALHGAALADEPASVRLLVNSGAAIDARGGRDELTPLFLAVMKGNHRTAAALLELHADPNARASLYGDEGGRDLTPLHIAARDGSAELVRLLVERGADVPAKDADGRTAESLAAHNTHAAVAAMLATYRRAGLAGGRATADLLVAIEAGDSATVARVVVKQPALARAALPGGTTPLHLAAARGSRAVCDVLLAHGADPNAHEQASQWTPALRAFNEGHRDLCEYLHTREVHAPPKPAKPAAPAKRRAPRTR